MTIDHLIDDYCAGLTALRALKKISGQYPEVDISGELELVRERLRGVALQLAMTSAKLMAAAAERLRERRERQVVTLEAYTEVANFNNRIRGNMEIFLREIERHEGQLNTNKVAARLRELLREAGCPE